MILTPYTEAFVLSIYTSAFPIPCLPLLYTPPMVNKKNEYSYLHLETPLSAYAETSRNKEVRTTVPLTKRLTDFTSNTEYISGQQA